MVIVLRFVATVIVALAFAPAAADARTLFAPHSSSGMLESLTIGAGSTLTPVAGSPLTVGGGPEVAVFTPDGNFLFLTKNSTDSVQRFSLAADGTPTSLGTATGGGMTGPRGAAVSPDGTKLYVVANNGLHTFAIGAGGSLTYQAPARTMNSTIGVDIAVAPDGRSLYALGVNVAPDDIIFRMPVGPDGLPTANGTPVATAADSLQRLSVTPDGRFLYTASSAAGQQGVRGYAIGAGGALTPIPGSPFATGGSTFSVVTSPAAPVVFASEVDTDTVRGYGIASNGALTPVGPALATGGDPLALAVTPSGRSLFTGVSAPDGIARYNVATTGALTSAGANAAAPAGVSIGPHVSADQSPAAAFTASTAAVGSATQFDATGSTDPDGTVARYDWDFGDSTTLADGGARPTHSYAAAGSFTARVTVTDDEGCSTAIKYTGQVVACSGVTGASTTRAVTVNAAPSAAPALTPTPAAAPVPPPARRCASRRRFTAKSLGLRRGERITRAILYDGRKRVRTFRGARRSIEVRLTGLRRATYRLRITVTRRSGGRTKRRTITRTYRTCRAGS